MNPLFKKKPEKHIDAKRKNKEEMEGVDDNASAFMDLNQCIHEFLNLNQAESFQPESYISSELHANNKTRK